MRKNQFVLFCMLVILLFTATACGTAPSGDTTSGTTAAATSSVTADSTSTSSVSGTVTAVTNIVGVQFDVLKSVAAKFSQDNPNIKIDFTSPGKDYESIMKVKMAAKDMPDVFSTHGWAVARYGDFLLDLSGEPWASQVDSGIRDMITDNGALKVLPMDQNKWGLCYNAEILEKYGVQTPMKSLDDLMAACEAIKTKSGGEVSPMHIAGADNWPLGQIFDQLATPAFTTAGQNDQQSLLDGSFDWNKWTGFADKINQMYKKGYFNKDLFTAKYSDSAKAFAEGKAAITWYGNSIVEEAKKYNPNVKAGLQPLPYIIEGDDMSFLNGEQTTFGIWKESKNLEASKLFIREFAKPENVKALCESEQMLPGLTGVDADVGYATSYYEQFKDVRSFPIFDRQFLPNGMWDLMCKDGAEMFSGSIVPEQFSQDMKKDYERLRAAVQN